MGQMGFFDISTRYAGLDAKNDPGRVPQRGVRVVGNWLGVATAKSLA